MCTHLVVLSRSIASQTRRNELNILVLRDDERFECSGWLYITAGSNSLEMIIKIKHDTWHKAYIDKDLPLHWKEYIEQHYKTQTPGQASATAS